MSDPVKWHNDLLDAITDMHVKEIEEDEANRDPFDALAEMPATIAKFEAALVSLMLELVALDDPRVDAILAKHEVELADADGKPLFPRPEAE